MKRIVLLCLIGYGLCYTPLLAQDNSVGINTRSPNANAVLELVSPGSNQGLLIPKLTTAQKEAMASNLSENELGLIVYDGDLNQFFYWHPSGWKAGLGILSETEAGGDLQGTFPNVTIRDNVVDKAALDKVLDISGESAYGNASTVITITLDTDGRVRDILEVPVSVGSSNIVDLTISNQDIANQTITISKLTSEGNSNKVLTTDGSGNLYWADENLFLTPALVSGQMFIGGSDDRAIGLPTTGDLNIVNTGTAIDFQIKDLIIETGDIANNAIINEKIASGAVQSNSIEDGAITSEDLATGAVETSNILDATILTEDIADEAITTEKIASGAIQAGDIQDGAIGTGQLLDGDIQTIDINDQAVTSAKIANGTIVNEDISTGAVQSNSIEDGAIVSEDIAGGAVESSNILDETILTEDIADEAITTEKIAAGAIQAEDIATGAIGSDQLLDGDIQTIDINDQAVTSAKIANGTIVNDDIATGAVQSNSIEDATIISEDIANGAVESSNILDETILTEDIADGAVTSLKIANESITANDINTGAVGTSEILDGDIQTEDINDEAITTSKIANSTILNEDIATGAVQSNSIQNSTILSEDLATGAVETSDILNATILTEDLADGSVTSAKIDDGTIQAEDIGTGEITTDEILDETILTEDIADLQVTNDKIGANAVTNSKVERVSLLPDRLLGTQTANGRGLMVAQQSTVVIDFGSFGPTEFYVPSFITTNTSSVVITDANGNVSFEPRSAFQNATLNQGNMFIGTAGGTIQLPVAIDNMSTGRGGFVIGGSSTSGSIVAQFISGDLWIMNDGEAIIQDNSIQGDDIDVTSGDFTVSGGNVIRFTNTGGLDVSNNVYLSASTLPTVVRGYLTVNENAGFEADVNIKGDFNFDSGQKVNAISTDLTVSDANSDLATGEAITSYVDDKFSQDSTEIYNKIKADSSAIWNKIQTDSSSLYAKIQSDSTDLYDKLQSDSTSIYSKLQSDSTDTWDKIQNDSTLLADRILALNNELDSDSTSLYDKMKADSTYLDDRILTNINDIATIEADNDADSTAIWDKVQNDSTYLDDRIQANIDELVAVNTEMDADSSATWDKIKADSAHIKLALKDSASDIRSDLLLALADSIIDVRSALVDTASAIRTDMATMQTQIDGISTPTLAQVLAEGADANATSITNIDAITVNGNATLGSASDDDLTINSTIQGDILFEGSTDDGNIVTLSAGEGSANYTVTLPQANTTLIGATLTSPADNDVLVYNTSSSQFENESAIGFEAYMSGSGTVNGTDLIQFNSEVFDDGNVFDPSDGSFTAPRNGMYYIEAQMALQYNGNANNVLSIMVNGTEVARYLVNGSNNQLVTLHVSKTLKLVASDIITIMFTGSDGNTYFGGRAFTFISGHLVR